MDKFDKISLIGQLSIGLVFYELVGGALPVKMFIVDGHKNREYLENVIDEMYKDNIFEKFISDYALIPGREFAYWWLGDGNKDKRDIK